MIACGALRWVVNPSHEPLVSNINYHLVTRTRGENLDNFLLLVTTKSGNAYHDVENKIKREILEG